MSYGHLRLFYMKDHRYGWMNPYWTRSGGDVDKFVSMIEEFERTWFVDQPFDWIDQDGLDQGQ